MQSHDYDVWQGLPKRDNCCWCCLAIVDQRGKGFSGDILEA
jgi:hypothetical protein